MRTGLPRFGTRPLFLALLVGIVWFPATYAEKLHDPANPFDEGLILISTSHQQINLLSDRPLFPLETEDQSEWSPCGSFTVEVATPLPEWGVLISAEPLQGTTTQLSPDRIWVKTGQTSDGFVPLDSRVSVIVGNEYEPVFESNVDIIVRPDWLDAAGSYSGHLELSPYIPGYSNAGTQDYGTDKDLGEDCTIEISFFIPEVIELSVSEATLTFDAKEGPGTYQANETLTLWVSSNTVHWVIICEMSSLRQSDNLKWEIPPERIHWKMQSDDPDMIESSGTLQSSTTILDGDAPVEDLKVDLSFSITTLPSDPAGTYTARISIVAQVSQ